MAYLKFYLRCSLSSTVFGKEWGWFKSKHFCDHVLWNNSNTLVVCTNGTVILTLAMVKLFFQDRHMFVRF